MKMKSSVAQFTCNSPSLSVVLSFFSLSFMFFLCHENHQKAFATIGCNLRLWNEMKESHVCISLNNAASLAHSIIQ